MTIKKEVSAGGIVYKKEGENILWLATQHSQHKGWVFPKGLVGDQIADEPIETAALREVEEEGGVQAKIMSPSPITVSYSYLWNDVQVDKTVHYFLMKYSSGDPKNHDWEMMDARFMGKEEIKKILTYSSDKQAFEQILTLFSSQDT